MTDSKFHEHVVALASSKIEPSHSVKDEAERVWTPIEERRCELMIICVWCTAEVAYTFCKCKRICSDY